MTDSLLGWIPDHTADRIIKHLDPKFAHLTKELADMDQRITDAIQRLTDKLATEKAEVIAAVQAGLQGLKDTITQLRNDLANGTSSVDETVAALDALTQPIDDLSNAAGAAATEGGTP